MKTVKELALDYTAMGMSVIPVPFKSKSPLIKGWQDLNITNDNLDQYFGAEPQNIAVLLGKDGSNLNDLDLDCSEARHFADRFAPKTQFRYGRISNPISHWIYKVLDGEKSVSFDHPEFGMLLEIRGKNHASILPGSVHPEGELYEASETGEPAEVSFDELHKSAALIAVCCLMSKYWPAKGMRNQAALTFSGFLAKAGYPKDVVISAVYEVAKFVGDEEAGKRGEAAHDTVEKFQAGVPVLGITGLREFVPDIGAKCFSKWLGMSPQDEVDEIVDKLNQKHAFIVVGGTQRVLTFKVNPVSGESYVSFMKLEAFKGLYKKDRVAVSNGKGGVTEKSIAEIWQSHPARRTYEDMVFEPGMQLPNSVFNYWQGYGLSPPSNRPIPN